MGDFIKVLRHKLKVKLSQIVPIIATAIVLSSIIFLVMYLTILVFPKEYGEIIGLLKQNDFETNKDYVKHLFLSFGESASYVFLLIQLLQVVVAPIPGQFAGFLGGFIFGFWYGLLLTMLGLTAGSLIAIYIGRLLGERVVRKIISENIMKQFDYLMHSGGSVNFFMIFLLPVLPDDAVCFIAGLTKIPIRNLMFVCVLGRLPGMAVLTLAGASIDINWELAKLLFIIAMVLASLIWLFDGEVKQYLFNWSKQVKIN